MIESPEEALEEPCAIDDEGEARRSRIRCRWFFGGLGAGVALVFVATAAQVLSGDYNLRDAPQLLRMNLIFAPYLGILAGLVGLIQTRRTGSKMWIRPQFRTRTLMVVVACLAFYLAASLSSSKLRTAAQQYAQKANTSAALSTAFRETERKSETYARLNRANVEGLGAGRIPEGLLPGQRDFLRSLETDPKVTPEYRQYRRDLISDSEEAQKVRQENNADYLRRLVEYHTFLEAKYNQARRRPWLPVDPDPPAPSSLP